MKTIVLAAWALAVAVPAFAQIRAHPEKHILRNAPASIEEDTPAVAPPVNLRPTQLLRCPDHKGGVTLQDTPCKPPTGGPGTAAGDPAPEVIELSALPPRPQAEAPPAATDDGSPSRLTKGVLSGSWKLALLLACAYALFRLARYARDRFLERFPPPEIESRIPRRVR